MKYEQSNCNSVIYFIYLINKLFKMETIRINCDTNVKSKILNLLADFSSSEYEILNEDKTFLENKESLNETFKSMERNAATFFTLEEVDAVLESTIASYEN